MTDPIVNLLGLAMRAGKVITGNDACLSAIRAKKAALAIVAGDTGANARKKYADKCKYYDVPLIEMMTKVDLGMALGKPHNAVVVVSDPGFANRIRQMWGETNGGEAH
ncbi:MAG TPA: ribosomal L7Ae/L30e/S12e/Gadd45 family protein [Bacilli bacterium]|nr:ribosomal L7Ae/L30e/S12e/Gadd45 family protein [Bacilli bacterium]